jgi:hypothetical protein
MSQEEVERERYCGDVGEESGQQSARMARVLVV